MGSIYLLRHCEYETPFPVLPGRLPVRLSMRGLLHAEQLSGIFENKELKRIYTSAVLRCRQTSEIIANGKIPIIFDKRLLETLSAYQGYWKSNWNGENYHFYSHISELGGESSKDIYERIYSFWKELILNPSDESILVCSHGDPLVMLYSILSGLELPDLNESENTLEGWLGYGEFHQFQYISEGSIEFVKTFTEKEL